MRFSEMQANRFRTPDDDSVAAITAAEMRTVDRIVIESDRTLTLALPKTGLRDQPGELLLSDLGIPAAVYDDAGIPYSHPFGDDLIATNDELI